MTITSSVGSRNKESNLEKPKQNIGHINEEAELIQKAKEDISHFEPLYNRYFDSIFRFVYRKTDDEQTAADITSRVFYNAMNALERYRITEVSFGAWLYKIATNETYKFFRDYKKRHLSLEGETVDRIMVCEPVVGDDDQKMEVLNRLIGQLSDIEVRILELKFFENRNFSDIAFIVEMKESAVKMKLYRALDKLKKKYQEIVSEKR